MYIILSTLIGLCYGSFINVLIYRLPKKKSIISPRSFCPKCKNSIPLYRNIPVLSFIIQKGKCHNCKRPISISYPLIEITTGIIWFLFSYITFGNYEIDSIILLDFFFSIIIISFFIPLAIIDLKYLYFPYKLLIPIIVISLLYSIIKLWLFNDLNSILGISAALIFLSFIYTITKVWLNFKNRNEDPMGFGDILLIGMIMDISNWDELKTGDDAYDATFFKIDKCPKLAFECHQNLFDMYYKIYNRK